MIVQFVPVRRLFLTALLLLVGRGIGQSAVGLAEDHWIGAETLAINLEVADGLPQASSSGGVFSGTILDLERSIELRTWVTMARVHETLLPYSDPFMLEAGSRYYRLVMRSAELADDWTNQLSLREDHFFQNPSDRSTGAMPFVKFTIVLDDSGRVYFQDTERWPYHYQWAHARLDGYQGFSFFDFDTLALHPGPGQELVVGSVIRAPDPQIREAGIEFTANEAFPVEQIADMFESVALRLVEREGWRLFYMPSFAQQQATQEAFDFFANRGIAVASPARWVSENVCYNPGWALGKLVFSTGNQIAADLASGRLNFGDILVTDQLPSEIPVLAGILTFAPATPNSHPAILARSAGIPFAYANGAALQSQISSHFGEEILLVIGEGEDGTCIIEMTPTEGRITDEEREAILASKAAGGITISPKQVHGAISIHVDSLTPGDIGIAGGKAAHFGLLRQAIPNQSPDPVMAFTFDLWDAFLAQVLPGRGLLRDEISARLGGYRFPPDVAALRADLSAVRDLIQHEASFTVPQRWEILDALQAAGFLNDRKIRFRSSTNVEDSERFSGAGLYDSFSGCLADDMDSDDSGPSHCDPTQPKERGVFRALRKVYASFYNENAFLERLRYGVDESEVGMAVLVHHSFPDPTELANGVATLAIRKPADGSRWVEAVLVTQLGATSVTNPDGNYRPETVTATYETVAADATFAIKESSLLSANGSPVMVWESDYRELLSYLDAAARAYETEYPDKEILDLDFEYKKIMPDKIVVKQIRPIPRFIPVPPPEI